MKKEMICAGILAGGKSSRMGQNKAYLPVAQQTFLEHTVSVCSDFPQVLVSVDTVDRYAKLSYSFVLDEQKEFGPLEGIYQLLRASKYPYVLALATDMPALRKEFLSAFVEQIQDDTECLVATVKGKPQPLCAVYAKSVLPVLEQMRAEGNHRPRGLFEQVKTKYVELSDIGFSESVVQNINTPEEFAAWEKDGRNS